MTVKLQMLGTGSAFAKQYANNNGIISTSSTKLFIDCGITAPLALHQLGLTFDQLDGAIITHLHGDHVGGLEEYGFQMMFRYKRKPKLYIANTLVEPLWEHTLKGGMSQPGLECLEDVFDVQPLVPDTSYVIDDECSIRLIQTPHIPNKSSYSLLVNETFFYSADMRFQPQLLEQLVQQGVSSIWHDCQLVGAGEVHATITELLSLPPAIQSIISLMHYGDERSEWEGRTGLMPFVEPHHVYTIVT
ncbi:MBL fold metallo-hydrolase [Paenibacillus arenosi]|uniref:MBL fold metallo-hydrolase n=1 Tax=Paenibacillus arenosi TaxID=2774142 RepID=A0ABR9ASF6_9BACL|nr:MBL fold metallo-hydrolase [Paenibacillus arenosi]MBD8496811.1 MBL fold metallo-hydrolase [Paenibacillus arenosi]